MIVERRLVDQVSSNNWQDFKEMGARSHMMSKARTVSHMSSAPLHVSLRQCDPKQELEATSQVAVQSQDKLLFCCSPICNCRMMLSEVPCVALPDHARAWFCNASVSAAADSGIVTAVCFPAC